MAPTTIPIRLYSDRATKFVVRQGRPITVRKLTEASHAGLNIFRDYCANSSIHGFNLIETVYDKWRRDPVVVTFAEKPTPIYDIPFPAVTICPLTKVKSSVLNFTAVYQRVLEGSGNVTEEEYDQFLAMKQVCDFSFNTFLSNQSFDDNLVHVLQDMAPPFEETFLSCIWRNKYFSCDNLFEKTLTERGICYTFNGLSEDAILRKEQFHQDYKHLGEKRSSENWSMEQGYKPNLGLDVYPRRVVSSGSPAGLIVILKSDVEDMDYLCGNSFQGFQVQIHTPNQIPQISSQSIRVPVNHELTVRLDPYLITTSKNVKSYSAQKRRCYYPHERYLRFFRTYTKPNCVLECLSNFTLHMCGCVQYSMPRPPGVHICGIERLACCERAELILQEQGLGLVDNSTTRMLLQSCNCLPACIFLEYKTEISQAHFEWRRLVNTIHLFEREMNHSEMSSLLIYFKEAQFISIKRNQLFGVNDFIANCGGILGLFMGVSLLSIVEILYYFTLKPLINHFMRKHRKSHKIATVVPYVAGGTYSTTFNKFLRDVA
uniref:Pickpocket n=1 Tax=Anopheles maculatus TaxID=74869 RepID=A0A182T5M0_9DIPT